MADDTNWWKTFRAGMPVTENWAYFDHAGVAPLPRATAEVLQEFAADNAAHGVAHWTRWRGTVETARKGCCKLIGAGEEEIAIVHNTSEGIGFVAEGIPWRAGDNVVTLASEFPSNLYPWMNLARRGVETRIVPASLERVSFADVETACDGRTRAIAVSWVGYLTGFRNELDRWAELAQRRGALLFVDAIQGLGVLPIDVRQTPIDFLAADGHKWMLGPEGAGLLYVRRERLDMLEPIGVGWNSVRHSGDFTNIEYALKEDASRYEGGSHCLAAISGFAESLKLLNAVGAAALSSRIFEVTDRLCDRLNKAGYRVVSDRSMAHRSGIVAFDVPGRDPQQIKRDCKACGVILNCRGGRMRASPHVYVNDDDIDRLIDALS